MGLPPSKCLKARAFLGHARAEDKKLIKELSLEVLALKVPFRKPAVALFLNRSLVAEANFSGINLMLAASEKIQPAGHNLPENIKLPDAHESCKSARPATQLLSVHCLYQRLAKKCKGESIFSQESLWTRFRRSNAVPTGREKFVSRLAGRSAMQSLFACPVPTPGSCHRCWPKQNRGRNPRRRSACTASLVNPAPANQFPEP
jgi:hypothetical protein